MVEKRGGNEWRERERGASEAGGGKGIRKGKELKETFREKGCDMDSQGDLKGTVKVVCLDKTRSKWDGLLHLPCRA